MSNPTGVVTRNLNTNEVTFHTYGVEVKVDFEERTISYREVQADKVTVTEQRGATKVKLEPDREVMALVSSLRRDPALSGSSSPITEQPPHPSGPTHEKDIPDRLNSERSLADLLRPRSSGNNLEQQ